LGKETKMSKKSRNRTVPVKSHGFLKIGDVVVYNTKNDPIYKGDKQHITGVVKAINKLGWASNNAYEYKLNFGDVEYWVVNTKARKLRKGEDVGEYHYGKFRVGEHVFIVLNQYYSVGHYEADIKSIRIGYDNKLEYVVKSAEGHDYCVNEDTIRRDKIKLTDGNRFKVGDTVLPIYAYNRNYKSIVHEIFKYEDGKLYYSLKGGLDTIFDEEMADRWKLCKPPLIIVSDMDPYGEEDWGDDE
jgi:hypothetical protein